MSKTVIHYKDIAPGAAQSANFQSGDAAEFSALDSLGQENNAISIATLEKNAWLLYGTFELLNNRKVPFWSKTMSGDDCLFSDTPPQLSVEFNKQYSSLGLTLLFDSATWNYCTEINIKWYQQDTLKADVNFYPDGYQYFCQQKVQSFDKVVITFLKTSLPFRYVKLQQVIFGVYRTFDMTEIRSARVTNQLSHISTEIPISTLNWTLDSHYDIDFMFQLKQPMEVRNDDFLIGVYYITDSRRSSKTVYDISCQDALGVLDGDTFSGGVYTNYSAKQLLLDIVGTDFSIDFGDVQDRPLTGIVEQMEKRAAIQQVAFAWGICVATDGGAVIRVFNLKHEPIYIGPGRTYTGSTIQTSATITAVHVTAHSYTPNENGNVEIAGVKYEDTETIYTVVNPDVTASDKQNVIEITGGTLVSPSIGQETAQRVYDYYAKRNKANSKIVWRGELLGDCLSLTNSWGQPLTGNIDRMDITLSNTVAAQVEVQ